ncbi:flagellar protein FliT [Pseudazoarcus pumilus]|uniref:Flagellar protein FliT n=1 Tax=Pseudazoarcus pumilus TaxID=2067960 RepID=A0A2I6S8E5_9RHOO|nr:flagellar protein FliT [Pseudazoarcus pumilus]AUN95526.1 flagellar protein FliT [Pseudazoarcus pumilus]
MNVSVDCLQRMAELSERMLDAADAGDWDRLVELEREMKQARDTADAGSEHDDDATLLYKARLIERMLSNQQRILRQVRPWMDETRELLAHGSRDRAVRAAYGASRF